MIDSKSVIGKDIEAMSSMKEFIVSHEEIAANNMRRIRDVVLNRRDFLADVTKFYNEVKMSYKKEIEEMISKAKKAKSLSSSLLKKKERVVCVLLSTDRSLYGDILRNSYDLFKKVVEKENADVVIVGRMGKRFFEEDNPGISYTYFDFPDKGGDSKLFNPIIMHIIQYEKVIILHSKFDTLVRQIPIAFVISESQPDVSDSKVQIRYIFEPSLEKIIEYFEKEIFSSIFYQTMEESDLSKFASRMITLDTAGENIKIKLGQLYMKSRFLQHQKANKDQINSLSRVVLLRKNQS